MVVVILCDVVVEGVEFGSSVLCFVLGVLCSGDFCFVIGLVGSIMLVL